MFRCLCFCRTVFFVAMSLEHLKMYQSWPLEGMQRLYRRVHQFCVPRSRYFCNLVILLNLCVSFRNGTPQYRSSPHQVTYNPAENAILVCSVSTSHLSVCIYNNVCVPRYRQNTTNADTAYYELFAVPKNTDPQNPECKHCVCMSCSLLCT